MKTSPVYLFGLGALFVGSLLVPPASASSEWQSLGIMQTIEPVFPLNLSRLGVTDGEACLAINTDADGRLVEWLVVGYTNKAFADSAVEAIKRWTFVPARLRDEPVGTTIELRFYFSAKGVVVSRTGISEFLEEQAMRMFPDRYAYFPHGRGEIDQVPTPVVTVMPNYGADLAKRGIEGRVHINFYIDESGAVRLPSVSARDSSVLTALAIDALKQWKFAPPVSGGRAVLVRASEEFQFGDGG
jgi:TonB family protein